MTIQELKAQVENYRTWLKTEATGKATRFSPTGPASMGMVDALVAAVEAQETRLAAIEAKIGVTIPARTGSARAEAVEN